MNRGINHIGLTVPSIEKATAFFKQGLDGKIAYDSQTKNDEPRGGEYVEHILGLEKGTSIIHKRMMVFGCGPNIEMFEFQHAQQHVKQAGGEPLSEPHSNTKYENTENNKTVYIRAPWGSLIELQTVPNGFYYPKDSEAKVFIPKSNDE